LLLLLLLGLPLLLIRKAPVPLGAENRSKAILWADPWGSSPLTPNFSKDILASGPSLSLSNSKESRAMSTMRIQGTTLRTSEKDSVGEKIRTGIDETEKKIGTDEMMIETGIGEIMRGTERSTEETRTTKMESPKKRIPKVKGRDTLKRDTPKRIAKCSDLLSVRVPRPQTRWLISTGDRNAAWNPFCYRGFWCCPCNWLKSVGQATCMRSVVLVRVRGHYDVLLCGRYLKRIQYAFVVHYDEIFWAIRK